MAKNKTITLNQKSLTRKEIIKLVEEQGEFQKDYSDILTERFEGNITTLRHVYKLPNDRYLYIRDVDGKYEGKGDIYPKEYFEKFVQSIKRMEEDITNGRTSNISHWRFYSKHKSALINNISELLTELSLLLKIDPTSLDFSTKSLDLLSSRVKQFGADEIFETLYDNLVAYLGEVIKLNSKNQKDWCLHPDFKFPVISTDLDNVFYSPVNIIWEELTKVGEPDFRKAYGKELRNVGAQISGEKTFRDLFKKDGS